MADLSQDIKISCHTSVIKGKMSNEGHPWRNWKITLVAMDGEKEVKGRLTLLLDHVDYILHPTFKDPRRVATKEPYLLQEKGWGEFDMRVVLYFTNNLVDPQVLLFDLNFAQSNYSTVKKVEFPDAPPEFAALLQKTLPPPRLSKRKGESDISSQEDNEESRPKVKMEDMEEGEESDGGYEKAAPAKKTKKIVQKKPERRVERQKKKGESSTSSNSDSEHDDKKKYNSAKKKPASTGNHEKVSKKSTVLKHIKSEEASPNTNLIPSTPIDPKMTPTKKRRLLDEVHIYSADDLDKLSPVHSFPVDDDTRRRWKIPKCNMKELARRIMAFNGDQMKKFQTLLIDNLNDDMDIRVNNGENKDVTIDLYSLGTSFLQKLWEFTEASSANHNKKEEPGGGGGGGEEEEDGEVVEQGEYHSDLEHHRPNGYKYGYSSDHQSDLEDVGHHRHLNDYHDTSDMDIQDDDE